MFALKQKPTVGFVFAGRFRATTLFSRVYLEVNSYSYFSGSILCLGAVLFLARFTQGHDQPIYVLCIASELATSAQGHVRNTHTLNSNRVMSKVAQARRYPQYLLRSVSIVVLLF